MTDKKELVQHVSGDVKHIHDDIEHVQRDAEEISAHLKKTELARNVGQDALSYTAAVGAASECKNDVLHCGTGLRSGSKVHSEFFFQKNIGGEYLFT